MSNVIKTLSDGDIVRKCLASLHNKLVFTKLIRKQYDDRFAKTGAKNGGTLLIRNPNEFVVREGSVMDTQDILETAQELTVAKQLGVDLNFTSVERTMSMDDMEERVIDPAMSRLAAAVDAYGISVCYPYVANLENTTFGTKPVLADVLSCKAYLDQCLAPDDGRVAMLDTLAANSIITDGKTIFNPASEISRQYSKGLIGDCAGFKFYQSEMTPTHTNGTRDTAGTCNLSLVTNGATQITATHTSAETFKVGDVFQITGVYDVNPETKEAYPHLKQWSIAKDATATGSAQTLDINEPIYKDGAKQNCYCADWTATTAATIIDAAGSSGVANTAYRNALLFHPDAFTMASADLILPSQGQSSRAKIDNISMRIWQGADIINDKHPLRIDVLVGFKTIRNRWAARMSS